MGCQAHALLPPGNDDFRITTLDGLGREVGRLEQRVHEIIIDHAGPVSVIGFNPYSHAWFAERFPGVLRGLNSYNYADADHMAPDQRKAFSRLEHVSLARPHFLALGLDLVPRPEAAKLRAGGMPVIAWTIRDPADWERVKDAADNMIFEGFHA